MNFWYFVAGWFLGFVAGAGAMWVHLMQKYAGLPVHWWLIWMGFVLATVLFAAVLGWPN